MDEQEQAREELEAAVKKWLAVKAKHIDDDDNPDLPVVTSPVVEAWVVICAYTSTELAQLKATATAYECGESQPAFATRGLAMAGVDRWRNV